MFDVRYYSADQHGAFSVWTSDREGRRRVLSAYSVARTVIERHIKVRGEANPYQPESVEYLRSGDASPGALIQLEKPVRSQPGRISWQLKMLLQTNLIAGSLRQRLILERLEPCEGKLSRTVLRGGLSGRRLQAYPVRHGTKGVDERTTRF